MVPTYFVTVAADGSLQTRCPALAGKAAVITERKAKRSVSQNSRYWALLTAAGRELGYDDIEELHEGLALKFLRLPPLAPGVDRRRRTPKLNSKDFAEYADACERFLRQDLGCDLSDWDRQTAIMDGHE
jgi:hypothetical protein